jgi:hypothetical protein
MKKQSSKKEYTSKEFVETLSKSIYKTILKNMKDRPYKDEAEKVVRDILDPNSVAQVDPDQIPLKRTNIMNKAKPKGIEKLKNFHKTKTDKRTTVTGGFDRDGSKKEIERNRKKGSPYTDKPSMAAPKSKKVNVESTPELEETKSKVMSQIKRQF